MSDTPPDLKDLRRRIDEIDDRVQELLIERLDIVSRVATSKRSNNGVAAYQPAREADILRRLVARNHGALPPATLVRMWRELLGATTRLQGAFTIAVFAPAGSFGFWDLARDHYGSQTPMLTFRSIGQVIHAVTEGQAAIGVLPMPEEEDADPWWRHLLSSRESAPHVIARLPFGARGNARSDGASALAIGYGTPQPTGRDRTLFAIEIAADISRGRMFSMLASLGLPCKFMASSEHGDSATALIEVEGFVAISDDRLERLQAQLGPALFRLLRVGGYAEPFSAAEMSSVTNSGFVPSNGSPVTVGARD